MNSAGMAPRFAVFIVHVREQAFQFLLPFAGYLGIAPTSPNPKNGSQGALGRS